MIDVQSKVSANPDYQLTSEDIVKWEQQHGAIPANSLVVMNSGWYKRFNQPTQYVNMDKSKTMHFPGYSAAAAKALVERDIAGIGIDTLSIDHGPSKDFAAHIVMLQANKYQIENLNNLDQLPAKGATAIIGVLPIKGGSQAQARIFALMP